MFEEDHYCCRMGQVGDDDDDDDVLRLQTWSKYKQKGLLLLLLLFSFRESIMTSTEKQNYWVVASYLDQVPRNITSPPGWKVHQRLSPPPPSYQAYPEVYTYQYTIYSSRKGVKHCRSVKKLRTQQEDNSLHSNS